ncbi:MAG TPA: Ezrin/radixin/moesin family protein [Cytophagaceae bacterium]|jgi:hypothetical protein
MQTKGYQKHGTVAITNKVAILIFLSSKVLCFSILFFLSLSVNAQNKAEEKEWAKKMKQMKPMDFKKLVEDNESLKASAEAAESSKATLQADLDSKNTEIEKLKAEVEASKAAAAPVASVEVAESSTATPSSAPVATTSAKGVQYKVQIGTFKNKNLTSYFNNNPNFSGETDPDGSKRYTLGQFKDYWEADKFKHYLREMGVRDAWVVAYKNGKRVDIKEVLEGSL